MSQVDVDLLSLRNFFYVGNHAELQSEADALTDLDRKQQTQREIYLVRDLAERGEFSAVLKRVDDSAAVALQAVKLLAEWRAASAGGGGGGGQVEEVRARVFSSLEAWLGDAVMRQDPNLRMLAAQLYLDVGNLSEALRLVKDSELLELKAMQVLVLLRLERVDLAGKVVASMQSVDDDDTLTTLAAAWVAQRKGADGAKEAAELIGELIQKFGHTVKLLNSLAVCHIQQANYSDAFQLLKTARALAIKTKLKVSAETLINTITCLTLMGKSTVTPRIIKELREAYPNHPWLAERAELEDKIDTVSATYKLS